MVAMADHRRKIFGDSKLAVFSMNRSIQEPNRRASGTSVGPGGGVVFKPVRVRFNIPVTFVPTCFTVIGNRHSSPVGEWDLYGEECEELWDDCVFGGFGVGECECVVVVYYEGGDFAFPDSKHRGVDYVGKAALRIIRDSFT